MGVKNKLKFFFSLYIVKAIHASPCYKLGLGLNSAYNVRMITRETLGVIPIQKVSSISF